MDAVGVAARAIKSGETELMIAGGVESMSRAPFVMGKADTAFSRNAEIFDTTIGWRFVNPLMKSKYGVDSMPETAENVAEDFNVSREDQDAFALRTQQRWAKANAAGFFADELIPVCDSAEKGRSEEGRHGRASAAGYDARGAGEAEAGGEGDGHGDGGQCFRGE